MLISDWSADVCSSDLRGRSARDPLLVVVGAGTDAGDKRAHSRSFRALEPSIGNIKVVNNFAERPQRGVGLETGEEHQGLEGAAVAFVGELSVRHVEPQFVRLRHISFALDRSEEHTSELQSLMRISYAVFCLQKKTK